MKEQVSPITDVYCEKNTKENAKANTRVNTKAYTGAQIGALIGAVFSLGIVLIGWATGLWSLSSLFLKLKYSLLVGGFLGFICGGIGGMFGWCIKFLYDKWQDTIRPYRESIPPPYLYQWDNHSKL